MRSVEAAARFSAVQTAFFSHMPLAKSALDFARLWLRALRRTEKRPSFRRLICAAPPMRRAAPMIKTPAKTNEVRFGGCFCVPSKGGRAGFRHKPLHMALILRFCAA
jgi:hypothetical protein